MSPRDENEVDAVDKVVVKLCHGEMPSDVLPPSESEAIRV